MKAPQHKPTVEELVDLGAIVDGGKSSMVGVILGDRVLLVNPQSSLLMDAPISKALIRSVERKRGISQVTEPEVKKVQPAFEAPTMSFIPEEPIEVGGDPVPGPEFDMGRAKDKKVLGREESEELELPSWLNNTAGLASGNAKIEEGW